MHTYRAHTTTIQHAEGFVQTDATSACGRHFRAEIFLLKQTIGKRSTCALSWNRTDRCILFRTEAASALRRWSAGDNLWGTSADIRTVRTVSTCNASLQIYHWKKRSCKRTVDAFNKLNLTSRKSAALLVCCRPNIGTVISVTYSLVFLFDKKEHISNVPHTSTSPTNWQRYPIAPWSVPVQVKVPFTNRITWRDNANSHPGLIHHPLTDLWSRKAMDIAHDDTKNSSVWNM